MKSIRSCVACRGTDSKQKLLRLAVKDSEVFWDKDMRSVGRGAYLHPKLDCIVKFPYLKGMGRFFRVEKLKSSITDLVKISDQLVAGVGIKRPTVASKPKKIRI